MRHQRKFQQPQNRLLLGVFIVIIGVLSLIDNLGYFDTHLLLSFWPMVFVILGVIKISQARRSKSYFAGGVLIAIGTLMTLKNNDLIQFSWHQWWPAFMIAGGFFYILRGLETKYHTSLHYHDDNQKVPTANYPQNADTIAIIAIMSGTKSSNSSSNFQGGEITAIMGSVELDLRAASIAHDVTIEITAIFGGVQIKVPNDWFVVMNGMPIMGGMEDHSVPPMNPLKRLLITGSAIMGGVEIKN